jgi:hypothetical protein
MKNNPFPFVNLVPREQVLQRQQSQWVTRWFILVLFTTFIVGLPGLYIGGSAALADSGMSTQIKDANIAHAKHELEIPLLRSRLELLAAEQEVLDLVENRIEWRDVFSLLVDSAGNDVRFRGLSATGGGIEGKDEIEIHLDGLAPSQTIARAFVVDLEATRVFDSVELIETLREQVNDLELIRFRVMIKVSSKTVAQEGDSDGN